MFNTQLAERISSDGIIAVLIIDSVEAALPLGKALLDGGVTSMELTLRTPAALEALTVIKTHLPEMLAGVGTILTPQQVQQVKQAGAAFGVAPGCNPRILAAAQENELPFAPGIATPSDIEQALEFNCRVLKFFPAESSGGLAYLKSMAAPYAHLGLQYIPLGGVSGANLAAYAADERVLAVGGSWLAPRELIQSGNWQQITRNATQARQVIQKMRESGATPT